MSEAQQQTIFGEQLTEQVEIETTGRVIRPFKRMLDQIAAEYRLHFDSEGIQVSCVDTANVIGINATLPADAFESYELKEETTIGVNSRTLGSVLQHARYGKSSDDAITISADSRTMESEVDREFEDCAVTLSERSELIDPDAIREEPEWPELDLDVSADLAPKALIDVLDALGDGAEHIKLGARPESLVLKQETDIQERAAELDVTPTEVAEYTYFSMGYVNDMKKALSVGYVDDLTLRWDEEFPLFAEFERDDTYHGEIMLAPRIKPE
jgi:proliferating cell nuclear antigen